MTFALVIHPLTVKNLGPVRLFGHVRLIGRIRYDYIARKPFKIGSD